MEKDSNISIISTHDDCSGTVVRSVRDMHPAHYILKIDSFSFLVEMLKECGSKSYDSDIFEASGHKWKLTLYPNGDKERNGEGYISLYLSIQDTNDWSLGWDIYAEYKFFVLDQIRDEYLMFEDAVKQVRRFRENKKEWGFAKLLSRNDFDDATKGYLMQDKCMFGVEIFVYNYNGRGECLGQPHKLGSNSTYTWKVTNYSTLPDEYQSPVFTLGNCKWKLALYPKGNDTGKGESVSVYLELDDLNPIPRVYASFKMSIKSHPTSFDKLLREYKATCLFSATNSRWGWPGFLSLKDIEDASKGFLVKDTLTVEVEITRISTVKSFS